MREAKPGRVVAASGGGGARPLRFLATTTRRACAAIDPASAGACGREAWTRVADQVARNDVDESLRRLLPTLYPHYISAGFKHPAVAHIRGLYGLARALGARVRESAADAASILADAGIPVLVLKGVPLAKEYYEDFGARPMSDADLMVPESVTIEQIRTLLEGTPGWVFEARADIEAQPRFAVHPTCRWTSIGSYSATRPSMGQRTRFGRTPTNLCSVTALLQFVRCRRSTKFSTESCTGFRGIESHRTAGLSMWGRSSGSHQTSIGTR